MLARAPSTFEDREFEHAASPSKTKTTTPRTISGHYGGVLVGGPITGNRTAEADAFSDSGYNSRARARFCSLRVSSAPKKECLDMSAV